MFTKPYTSFLMMIYTCAFQGKLQMLLLLRSYLKLQLKKKTLFAVMHNCSNKILRFYEIYNNMN